jgi:hypothetical protein
MRRIVENVIEMADEPNSWRRATAAQLAQPHVAQPHVAQPYGHPLPGARALRRHPSQIAVLVVGVVYVTVGVAGLLLGRGQAGAAPRVLGFEVGLADNLVRVNVGLLGLAMWAERRTARTFGKLLAVAYGVSVVVGLLGTGPVGVPPLHGPDGLLHLGNAVAAHWPAVFLAKAECGCGQAVQARTLGEPCTMAVCAGQAGGERVAAAAQGRRPRL